MRTVFLLIGLLAVGVVETSFIAGLTAGAFFPNLLLSLCLALALTSRPTAAYVAALCGGTILELLGAAVPGTRVIPIVAGIAAVRLLQTRALSHRSTVSLILLSFLGAIVAAGVAVAGQAVIGSTPDFSRPALLTRSLSVVSDALLAIGIAALASASRRVFERTFLRSSHGTPA